jgi:hypothetical protein
MNDPMATYICHFPSCTTEVKSGRGSGAYCPEHRGKRASNGAARTSNGLVGQLDALKAIARQADKLEAKATRLRAEADKAAFAAGEKRDEFAERMRSLSA